MAALLVLAQLQSPLAVRADTVHPSHDALHYDITLVVEDTTRHILGEVETTWRLRSSAPVEVALDSAMRVVRVLIDGMPNSRIARTLWGRPAGMVVIPHGKRAGDTLTTRIRYHGYVTDGLIIKENAYGARTAFADNWPDRAHRWFPSQDHPSDKATVAFHVQASMQYQVITNGVLQRIDTLAYGNRVWHYRMDTPIPVYTMVVGVARMAVTPLGQGGCPVRCVPISVWSFPEDSAYAVTGPFRRATEIVDYFSRIVGPISYPSLAHVESSTIFGGMENATAIFYDEKAYKDRRLSESVVAHETAHQWFGDAVTEADWHHLWLSEGFASYFEALWAEHTAGDSGLRAVMRAYAAAVLASPATERPILDSAATDLMKLLNSNNYPKGAWVLHQLRGLVGDTAFFAGLRRYYATYRDSTALSIDFARTMSEAAGTDLDWYFRQALLQPGYPKLDVRWRLHGDGADLTIRQTQPDAWGTYRLPKLELTVAGKAVTVDVTGRETRLHLPGVPGTPSIEVDPHGRWLLAATVGAE